ncbi:CPBP family intramembrane glutamic endopeptidase [Hahella sp. HN01]|uniref:CPBP family intramembrane glutamic endopeptidase n=1 Tax=Hahella sp. HN01 TaxID=2847262 RepID=UPI001C1EB901|nr:CPBP family intramembrane glutamic endopeptidase [Hahella sp. HN01]MBU6951761.1 CPBP family intramembrane metalloprotease [Hahella sp. HN01]
MVSFTLTPAVIWVFSLYALSLASLMATRSSRLPAYAWTLPAAASLGVAFYFGLATWIALLPLATLWAAGLAMLKLSRWRKALAWLATAVLSLALALHLTPGFTHQTVIPTLHLGAATLPFALSAKLDKALAGLLLVALFLPYLPTLRQTGADLRRHWPLLAASLGVIFGTGALLGVDLDPKTGSYILVFAFFNLLVTCIAEETFFRLLVQRSFVSCFANLNKVGLWGVWVAGTLFGLAHFHTGPGAALRMALITLAGYCYAWVYYKTQNFWLSVLLHFLVNIIHISLFVYPADF